jgi:predicted RNA-binding Zn-ribbon protein involved in translation (DUF1610 family)
MSPRSMLVSALATAIALTIAFMTTCPKCGGEDLLRTSKPRQVERGRR